MKTLFKYIGIILFSLSLITCSKISDKVESTDSGSTVLHDDPNDYILDTTSITHITLNGSTITVDGEGATVSGTTVVITTAGTFGVSGTLTNGQILVSMPVKGTVRLLLYGINVTNSSSAPFYVERADKLVVYLADGYTNTLTDGTSYTFPTSDTSEPNACLFSTAYLTFFGNGTLTVKGNYNDGITSKDGLIIKNGTLNVVSKDDGIRGKDYLVIENGTIGVTSGGDGLTSDNESSTNLGYVTINDGSFNITATRDGISAKTNVSIASGSVNIVSGGGSSATVSSGISAKGIKAGSKLEITTGTYTINSADDALHSNGTITLNGGIFNLASNDDGMHADGALTINGDELTVSKSYEAVESPAITVNGGIINLASTDDAFNASKGSGGENNDGSMLTINGGTIIANPTTGDGLDSNGSIVITGGTVIVHGPKSQPELGLDYNGTCTVSNTKLVISGINSNMTQTPGTSSAEYSVKLTSSSTLSASTLIHVQDASGNDVMTFQPIRSYNSIIFSTTELQNGVTYYVYTGGTSSGTNYNGLYSGGSYSGGTQKKSFIISGKVTSVSF